ncbi:MAG: hypothetical protein NZ828_01740 [Alphaproteobacteria bacterium]|nr:hypothetical protein [Alphaproteobacteria bacterium]
MVEAKGYWLSVQTQKNLTQSEDKRFSPIKPSNYIVKIHHQDSPIVGMAVEFRDALQSFKEKLAALHHKDPASLPQFEHFDDVVEQEDKDIAMVFLSEYEILDAIGKAVND